MNANDEALSLLLEVIPIWNAELAKQLLDEAGIGSTIRNPAVEAWDHGIAREGLHGTNVYVPQAQVQHARAVLEEAWGAIPSRFDPRAH